MTITAAQLAADPLGKLLVETVRAGSLAELVKESFTDRITLTILAGSASVGDLLIRSDSDELTISIGHHTHLHFSLYMHQGISPEHAIHAVVAEALKFVQDLLKDRIVVWSRQEHGRVTSGGAFYLESAPTFLEPGSRAYLWSGAQYITQPTRGGA